MPCLLQDALYYVVKALLELHDFALVGLLLQRLQPPLVGMDLADAPVLRSCRRQQTPSVVPHDVCAALLRLCHSPDEILRVQLPMGLLKAPAIASACIAVLVVVDPALADHILQPFFCPRRYLLRRCFAVKLVLHCHFVRFAAVLAAVLYHLPRVPDKILCSRAAVHFVFCVLADALRLAFRLPVEDPCKAFCVFLTDRLPHALQFRLCHAIRVSHVHLHDDPCEVLHAYVVRIPLQRRIPNIVVLSILVDRTDILAFIRKISRLDLRILRDLLRDFPACLGRFLFDPGFAERTVSTENPVCYLPRQVPDAALERPLCIRVHAVLHGRVGRGRRPCVRAIYAVPAVRLGVDRRRWEHDGIVSVVCMPLLGLHDSDGRRRKRADLQRLLQLLLCQVVLRDEIPCTLHRLRKRKSLLDIRLIL